MLQHGWTLKTVVQFSRSVVSDSVQPHESEDVACGEIRETEEDKRCTGPLTWGAQDRQVHGDRERKDGCRAWGGAQNDGLLFKGLEHQWAGEKALHADGGDGYTTMCVR